MRAPTVSERERRALAKAQRQIDAYNATHGELAMALALVWAVNAASPVKLKIRDIFGEWGGTHQRLVLSRARRALDACWFYHEQSRPKYLRCVLRAIETAEQKEALS